MRTFRQAVLLSLVSGLVFFWTGRVFAEPVTVEGEIVDLACYLGHGKRGAGHASCAKMCAKGGKPIGLLTENGELYLLIDDHANSEPYEEAKKLAGENAVVKGEKHTKHGMSALTVLEARSR
ncbi:MAG: hypothetical protein KatS3mg076_0615 [Candidatus Binatia bacterium]|nr:MAG: hypothetical protein KatS3mg076_0615 [Candidatus Binatia bacterium]